MSTNKSPKVISERGTINIKEFLIYFRKSLATTKSVVNISVFVAAIRKEIPERVHDSLYEMKQGSRCVVDMLPKEIFPTLKYYSKLYDKRQLVLNFLLQQAPIRGGFPPTFLQHS